MPRIAIPGHIPTILYYILYTHTHTYICSMSVGGSVHHTPDANPAYFYGFGQKPINP